MQYKINQTDISIPKLIVKFKDCYSDDIEPGSEQVKINLKNNLNVLSFLYLSPSFCLEEEIEERVHFATFRDLSPAKKYTLKEQQSMHYLIL